MKPSVIHNPNSGSDINNYSDPNANINPDIQQSHQPQQQQQQPQQQHPHAQQPQQQQPQGIYDTNGLAGGANSRRFPFYPTGFDFFDDDDLFSDGGVRSRMNRIRDPFGTWGRKRRNSQEHIQPQQTAQTGGIPQAAPQTQQIPPPDEGYEDDFFPKIQPGWGADSTWGRQADRKRNPHLDDDDDFFSYIPQQFRQYIPSNFQLPRMRSHFGRQPVPQPATNSPQNRNFFPQQQSPPQQQQQQPMHPEPMNRPKYCDAAMQTDAELLAQSQANSEQPNLNQHGLRNTIDMGQKTNDEADEAGPRARSAPPDPNYDPNNPNNFASAQSFSSAAGFPGQKPHVYAQATATPGAHAQAHAQAHTANMGTNTGPGTPNGGNFHRQYYYPFDNNAPPPSSPPRQPQQQQQQQAPPQPQTPNQDGQFIRTVPIVIESRKVPAKPKQQPQQQTPPQAPPQPQQQQQQQPRQNSQPREIPIRVEHVTTQKQAPPSPAAQAPSSPQPADPEQSKTPAPHDPITKIQAIQKEVMELMLAVEQFKGIGRDKEYMYLDEMLTRNLIKLDDIETDGKENIRLARKEAIKCIQASLCVLEMKADGRIPVNESKSDDTVNKPNESQTIEQEIKSPEDNATHEINQEKTENVGDKKDEADKTETITDKSETKTDSQAPTETNEINTVVENKENEPENKVETATKEEVVPEPNASDDTNKPAVVVIAEPEAEGKPAEST